MEDKFDELMPMLKKVFRAVIIVFLLLPLLMLMYPFARFGGWLSKQYANLRWHT